MTTCMNKLVLSVNLQDLRGRERDRAIEGERKRVMEGKRDRERERNR